MTKQSRFKNVAEKVNPFMDVNIAAFVVNLSN